MLGSKYENLLKLKNSGFNVADFEIIKFEDAVKDSDEIIKTIQNNKEKSSKEISTLLRECLDKNIKKDFKSINCEFKIEDGSGLSTGNRLSSKQVLDLLIYMYGRDDIFQEYLLFL